MTPPFIVQEYRDHNNTFYKVYVINNEVMVFKRSSLPNLDDLAVIAGNKRNQHIIPNKNNKPCRPIHHIIANNENCEKDSCVCCRQNHGITTNGIMDHGIILNGNGIINGINGTSSSVNSSSSSNGHIDCDCERERQRVLSNSDTKISNNKISNIETEVSDIEIDRVRATSTYYLGMRSVAFDSRYAYPTAEDFKGDNCDGENNSDDKNDNKGNDSHENVKKGDECEINGNNKNKNSSNGSNNDNDDNNNNDERDNNDRNNTVIVIANSNSSSSNCSNSDSNINCIRNCNNENEKEQNGSGHKNNSGSSDIHMSNNLNNHIISNGNHIYTNNDNNHSNNNISDGYVEIHINDINDYSMENYTKNNITKNNTNNGELMNTKSDRSNSFGVEMVKVENGNVCKDDGKSDHDNNCNGNIIIIIDEIHHNGTNTLITNNNISDEKNENSDKNNIFNRDRVLSVEGRAKKPSSLNKIKNEINCYCKNESNVMTTNGHFHDQDKNGSTNGNSNHGNNHNSNVNSYSNGINNDNKSDIKIELIKNINIPHLPNEENCTKKNLPYVTDGKHRAIL